MKVFGSVLAALVLAGPAARAEIAVSANDGKAALIDGRTVVPARRKPDTISIIDLSASPPRVTAELRVPTSVIGPPTSVAIAPDESFAVVSAATKIDPKDAAKTIPDDTVSVIDLAAKPPRVVQTLKAGAGASGVAISPSGLLVLVADRGEGAVSVFTVANKTLTPQGKITLGETHSGPSGIAITPDGRSALVTRDGDSTISLLTIDLAKVAYSGRDVFAGIKPYAVDIQGDGHYAAVANIGMGGGDADTVSLIDMQAALPHVVDTLTVGQTPEGLKMSADGRYIAVAVMNGSNKPKGSPFRSDHGSLVVLGTEGGKLRKFAEAPVGHWCQGAAWSHDGKKILVQCMVEQEIEVFGFDGYSLKRGGTLRVSAAPAAIGTAR